MNNVGGQFGPLAPLTIPPRVECYYVEVSPWMVCDQMNLFFHPVVICVVFLCFVECFFCFPCFICLGPWHYAYQLLSAVLPSGRWCGMFL